MRVFDQGEHDFPGSRCPCPAGSTEDTWSVQVQAVDDDDSNIASTDDGYAWLEEQNNGQVLYHNLPLQPQLKKEVELSWSNAIITTGTTTTLSEGDSKAGITTLVGEGSAIFIVPLKPPKHESFDDDYGTRLYIVSLWKKRISTSSSAATSATSTATDLTEEHAVFVKQGVATLPLSVRPWHKVSPFYDVSLNTTLGASLDQSGSGIGPSCRCISPAITSSSYFVSVQDGCIGSARVLIVILVVWLFIDVARRVIILEKKRQREISLSNSRLRNSPATHRNMEEDEDEEGAQETLHCDQSDVKSPSTQEDFEDRSYSEGNAEEKDNSNDLSFGVPPSSTENESHNDDDNSWPPVEANTDDEKGEGKFSTYNTSSNGKDVGRESSGHNGHKSKVNVNVDAHVNDSINSDIGPEVDSGAQYYASDLSFADIKEDDHHTTKSSDELPPKTQYENGIRDRHPAGSDFDEQPTTGSGFPDVQDGDDTDIGKSLEISSSQNKNDRGTENTSSQSVLVDMGPTSSPVSENYTIPSRRGKSTPRRDHHAIFSPEEETYNSTLPPDSDYDSAKDVAEHNMALETHQQEDCKDAGRHEDYAKRTTKATKFKLRTSTRLRIAQVKPKKSILKSRQTADDCSVDSMGSRSIRNTRKRQHNGLAKMDTTGQNRASEGGHDEDDDVEIIGRKPRPFEKTDYLGKIVLSKRMRNATAAWTTDEQDYVFPDVQTSSSS